MQIIKSFISWKFAKLYKKIKQPTCCYWKRHKIEGSTQNRTENPKARGWFKKKKKDQVAEAGAVIQSVNIKPKQKVCAPINSVLGGEVSFNLLGICLINDWMCLINCTYIIRCKINRTVVRRRRKKYGGREREPSLQMTLPGISQLLGLLEAMVLKI